MKHSLSGYVDDTITAVHENKIDEFHEHLNEQNTNIQFTLRRLLANVKGKDKPEDRPGAVYKIHYSDCQATYIGDTGGNLTTRITEHKRATKKGALNSNIAEDHLKISHAIDWDSATCLTYTTDYYQRITLESWFTNLKQIALNRCQPLSAPYNVYSTGNINTLFIIHFTTHLFA